MTNKPNSGTFELLAFSIIAALIAFGPIIMIALFPHSR